MSNRLPNTWTVEKLEKGFVVYQGHTGDRFVNKMFATNTLEEAITVLKRNCEEFEKIKNKDDQ